MHNPVSSWAFAQQHFHAQASYYRFGALSDANTAFLYHAQHSIFTYALHLAILHVKLAVATVIVARQSTDH